MSGQPRRPAFYDGQVLAAADLTAAVDHAGQLRALHERSEHTWGIVAGLDLDPGDEQTHESGRTFHRVEVAPGAAVDGTGRQILVAERQPVSEAAFMQLNGTVAAASPETWFPVFLTARDDPAPPETLAFGACGGAELPTRMVEGFDVGFGRAGDELALDEQRVPAVDETAADLGTAPPWRVLLGFVRWDPVIERFADARPAANGIGRRYGGVQADAVAARDGRLEARTRVAAALGTPAIVVDEEEGGRFSFGLHDGVGGVTPVVTVNASGDVRAEGTVFGALTTGTTQVQSGVATDGVVLPLPPGITEDQVDGGQVTVHVHVTVHVPPSPPPSANAWFVPLDCSVDAERRVRCVVRWFDGGAAQPDSPAACDYLVVAAVPATGGG